MPRSLGALLCALGEPGVVLGLGDDPHTRLHAGVAGAAELRAEDGINAFADGSEVDVEGGPGNGVLFEAHVGDKEAVNDVDGAELEVDFAMNGKDQLAGYDVVGFVGVG